MFFQGKLMKDNNIDIFLDFDQVMKAIGDAMAGQFHIHDPKPIRHSLGIIRDFFGASISGLVFKDKRTSELYSVTADSFDAGDYLGVVKAFCSNGSFDGEIISKGYCLIHKGSSVLEQDNDFRDFFRLLNCESFLIVSFGCDIESRLYFFIAGHTLMNWGQETVGRFTIASALIFDVVSPILMEYAISTLLLEGLDKIDPTFKYCVNHTGQFLSISESCFIHTGYEPDLFVKEPDLWKRLLDDEGQKLWQSRLDFSKDNYPRITAIRVRLNRKDGEVRWFSFITYSFHSPDRDVAGYCSVGQDLGTVKGLENEFQKLIYKYSHQVELHNVIPKHANSIEIWLGKDFSIGYMSGHIFDMTGFNRQYLSDINRIYAILHSGDRYAFKKILLQIRQRKGFPVEKDLRIFRADMQMLWVRCRIKEAFDELGRSFGFRISLTDVSDIKLSEVNLRLTMNELSSLNDTLKIVSDFAYDLERWVLPDGNVKYISLSCQRITGYSQDEFMQDPGLFKGILHPDDLLSYEKNLELFNEGLNIGFVELRIITKNEEIKWIEGVAKRIYDKDGNYLGFRSSWRDIDSRKKLDEKVHSLLHFNESIISLLPGLLFRMKPNGYLTFANPFFCKIYGIDQMDIEGISIHDIFSADELERLKLLLEEITSVNSRIRFEKDTYFNDNPVWIDWIYTGLFDEQGRLYEIQGRGDDITNIKNARIELENSKRMLEIVVSNQTELIVRHTIDGLVTYANEAFLKFTGNTKESLFGINYFQSLPERILKEIQNQIRDLETGNFEYLSRQMVNKRYDGVERWFEWISNPIFDGNHRLKELLVVGRDITDLKSAQLELENLLRENMELQNQLEEENRYLRQNFREAKMDLFSENAELQKIYNQLPRISHPDTPIFLHGEIGSGREKIANYIHDNSPRRHRAMISLNCASRPKALLESELFGREKGDFTGQYFKQTGLIEKAHLSTLYIDEISELPYDVQAKLLHFVETGQYQRVESEVIKTADVRIVSSSSHDIAKLVDNNIFGRDLYLRLNVIPLYIPPLRERIADIPRLVWEAVDEISIKLGRRIDKITSKSMKQLQAYDWPGNLRELRNVIEYNLILSTDHVLDIQMPGPAQTVSESQSLENIDREHILRVLDECNWRIRGIGGGCRKTWNEGINPPLQDEETRDYKTVIKFLIFDGACFKIII